MNKPTMDQVIALGLIHTLPDDLKEAVLAAVKDLKQHISSLPKEVAIPAMAVVVADLSAEMQR